MSHTKPLTRRERFIDLYRHQDITWPWLLSILFATAILFALGCILIPSPR